ncbi:MAG TPA: ABC transporter permease [Bryobacteraceae bacterium]|jgi:predicted permease|nr:ABC transporter permease [Bryobacteraceae bacterium]
MMLNDLRYALRMLRHNPGFALVAILSLALGIGANAAIFSLADGLILRPLPVPHAEQLIAIQSRVRGEGNSLLPLTNVSYPDFADLRDKNKSFAGLAASQFAPVGFATEKGALPEAKFSALVSGNFFRVLDVRPQLGRGFRPEEDQAAGRDPVVVISHDLWKNQFAAAPDVLGRTIYLSGIEFKVVGVAPESFTGPYFYLRPALYVPLAMGPRLLGDSQQQMLQQRDLRHTIVQGRLKPGVSLREAAAEVQVIAAQLAAAYPATNRNASLMVDTELMGRLKEQPGSLLLSGFLLILAGLVLLIACGNVVNLMLSRARGRTREIALRLAIGASRGRLIRQLLAESLVVALAGGACGLLLAATYIDHFGTYRLAGDVPVVIELKLDPRLLLFTLAAALASALLFGLAPALESGKTDLVRSLKLGRADDGKRRRFLGRNSLVIAQVAGSLVLLIFATQVYRGAAALLSSPGFRTEHILTASFNPTLIRYTPEQTQEFYKRLLEEARQWNGVESAALAQGLPLLPWTWSQSRVAPEGFRLPPGTESFTVSSVAVSDGYFAALDIPILRGRAFARTDTAATPRVAIVNEQFARKYYPHQDPIGKRFRLGAKTGPMVEIVGLAKQSTYMIPGEPAIDYLYVAAAQEPLPEMTLLLHTTAAPMDFSSALRELVRKLDPAQPLAAVRTMNEVYDQRATATVGMLTHSMAGMGLLGLALALVGLYGLMTYTVSLRQREIGIRMAIGAHPSGVLRMVLRQGLTLAGTGVLIGLALSMAASRALTVGLGVSSFNLPLVGLVAVGLLAIAALGAYIPARRASLLDPNVVLRQE